MERINKVLARSTDFSRREIDKFIMEGRIKVDGKLLTKPVSYTHLTLPTKA